jgi:hypothetical protein
MGWGLVRGADEVCVEMVREMAEDLGFTSDSREARLYREFTPATVSYYWAVRATPADHHPRDLQIADRGLIVLEDIPQNKNRKGNHKFKKI